MELLPLSVVVATKNRATPLVRMLSSLWAQDAVPIEMVIVDASADEATRDLIAREAARAPQGVAIRHLHSSGDGSAAQRNEGVCASSQAVVGFMDDDIVLEPDCMERLWAALHSATDVGGANAMITNQKYHQPGAVSRLVYRLVGGGPGPDYSGRIFGPAVNLLPADREGMPEVVPVGWLNTTCTLYRREALPDPPFASFFTGYSMMEDAALSLVVARKWKLVNARTARIFHDTQPGKHKDDAAQVARMAVVNRDFVARRILGKRGIVYWSSLVVWAAFQLAAQVGQLARNPKAWGALKGSIQGYADIVFGRSIAQY
jgi:glycosyltransferase involved in cell wall biosynthesis